MPSDMGHLGREGLVSALIRAPLAQTMIKAKKLFNFNQSLF